MRQVELRETQQVALQILKDISKLCEENNLRYYLFYGTLIGAIRHKGFIPWDDDLDLMMPREDHNKLIDILKKNKSFKYDVFTADTDGYPYMITRISNNNYFIVKEDEKNYNMGIFIDIYPFEGLGIHKKESLSLALKGDKLSSLYYLSTRKRVVIKNEKGLNKLIKPLVWIFAKIVGSHRWKKKIANLMKHSYDFDQSNYVGCLTWLSGGEKDFFERNWFDGYLKIDFENTEFRVPIEYDKVLRQTYGEYMKIPSEKERIGHHFYKVYRKE